MATLNVYQLQALVQLGRWISKDQSRQYQGNIQFRLADAVRMKSAACWNWALNGGAGDIHDPVSPQQIYQNLSPTYFRPHPRNPMAGVEVEHNAMPVGNLPVGWQNEAANLPAMWLAATDDRNRRVAFVEAMARVTARANGLMPTNQNTPYKIYVTVQGDNWFSWSHWGLRIKHGGHSIYMQTEPERPINFGFTRFWEAERGGYIHASFHILAIHDAHKMAAKLALMEPAPNA